MKTEKNSFGKRLKSMLKVDFRRLFTTPLFYLMVGICLVVPVLILVMTTMMDGSVSVDPNTGAETVIEAFDSTWQIIGTVSGESTEAAMAMDMTSMCNINLLYFFVAVFVCIFVADDFRSGYAKNLFTVRARKGDYVASKTIVCGVAGAAMILAFFAGAMVGGAVSGLSFDTGIAGMGGVIWCLLSKMLLVGVFVPIYVLMGVIAKQKLWMSILGSCMVGMFLFMMVPMLTPLNATVGNAAMCLIGSALFGTGLGLVSKQVLQKTALV